MSRLDKVAERAVAAILRLDRENTRTAVVNEFSARRIGRNEVWKLTPASGRRPLFVKFFNSSKQYSREICGLRIADELATEHFLYCAPRVVFADEQLPAIATTGLVGRSLVEVLRNAFRLDRNPLHRQQPIADALNGIQYAAQWLSDFHKKSITFEGALYDHSIAGVCERILRKLAKFRRSLGRTNSTVVNVLADAEAACRAAPSTLQSGPNGLVFGDVNPRNIFVDTGHVGFIDFEDIGIGEQSRDWTIFCSFLSANSKQWKYWSSIELPEFIDLMRTSLPKEGLFRLECLLDRLASTMADGVWRASYPRRLVHELEQTVGAFHDLLSDRSDSQLDPQRPAQIDSALLRA